ncbi:apolipoprotein N-acyltransferase [Deinococcus puniceus]|uniref:apolipoprotein N-acyltransferase n=1 Tax=Deinococcus puniceus TaxID=1182568 RepID=UPI001E3FD43B|nr:apolipoprotein N-acyltransferase [Deinococcus puniceus]
MRVSPSLPTILLAVLLGVLLALCGLPLGWSFLSFLPLAALLAFAAQGQSARDVAGRAFWAGSAYSAVHLWWLTAFLGKLFGFPPAGVLAFALFALEGAFLAGMAWLVGRLLRSPGARVWGLAGGWVVLEWLRFLGPPAFPWPTLGYTLLPTPAIQIADLGGVLLGSVLVAATAAALACFVGTVRQRGEGWGRRRPLGLMAVAWALALVYGLTRTAGTGPETPMLLLRTTIDSFDRASRRLSVQEQFELQANLTRANRRPEEVVVWSESSVLDPALLPAVPAAGIYGVSQMEPRRNSVRAWDGGSVTSETDKARPVPFGEYFPFREALAPAWSQIERIIGIGLESVPPAQTLNTLQLNGVQYGAYVCYDSVFPWVARVLVGKGAEVLVNVSNDGWYDGWGVQQHFMMGRVRAIETRRYVVRSVNFGIAAEIDDLGRPRQTLESGEGVLHARPLRLTGQTLFVRLGDWLALGLAGLMLAFAGLADRRYRRRL